MHRILLVLVGMRYITTTTRTTRTRTRTRTTRTTKTRTTTTITTTTTTFTLIESDARVEKKITMKLANYLFCQVILPCLMHFLRLSRRLKIFLLLLRLRNATTELLCYAIANCNKRCVQPLKIKTYHDYGTLGTLCFPIHLCGNK